MVDVLGYLKHTKNTLIGNPSAKLALKHTPGPEGPLLPSIVSYVNYNPIVESNVGPSTIAGSTAAQIRTEAANVVASLAHGPREVLFGLLEADAPSAILDALAGLSDHDPVFLKIAIVRALRALFVAIADCAGPSLWDLGEECCVDRRSEARSTLDYIFQASFERGRLRFLLLLTEIQTQALDVFLPLLESPTPMIKLYIAQLLAFGVRIPKHRIAVTDWLPPVDRVKESKGKRGWEVTALVDANSPSRQGGWVMRQLAGMLNSKDFVQQEVALYAVATLVKDNQTIALVLSKSSSEQKASQSVLSVASDLARDRKSEVRLAASLCITNIIRSANLGNDHRYSTMIIHVLSSIIWNTNEPAVNRAKACHILSWLVADNTDRCLDAWKSGALTKLAEVVSSVTPTTKPQEWEDGEAIDTSRLREAALTAIASLAMLSNDIRNEIAGVLNLLPLISVCLEHPRNAGVRYAACQCVRALGRSVRVLRTSLLDSGVGVTLCQIMENPDEDRRVMNIALAGLCNLLTDFSPLRQTIVERGAVSRIAELTRAPEDKLKISALWAVKNLLDKASSEDKLSIMKQVGWDHLRSCLVDPKEDIQEQALELTANIATSPDDVHMLLEHISSDELLKILADAMESPSEIVVLHAIKVINNISNVLHTSFLITSNLRILSSLRTSLLSHHPQIRNASILCVELLARNNPRKMREFGMDEALKHVLREASPVRFGGGGNGGSTSSRLDGELSGLGSGLEGEGRRRLLSLGIAGGTGSGFGLGSSDAGAIGSDGGLEVRELAQNALRALDGSN
ncbi:hypothetical protein ACEPAI_5177 [Sanghuangporus weigelae]